MDDPIDAARRRSGHELRPERVDAAEPRLRRADRVPAHRRPRGDAGGPEPRAGAPGPVGRRDDVHVRRCGPACASRPGGRCGRATSSGASSVARRRARGVRPARPDRVGRGRRPQPHARDPPRAARPGLPVPARAAVRGRRSPGSPEAAGHRRRPRARTGSRSSTGSTVRLERNPYFRAWSPLAKPDGYPDVDRGRASASAPDEAIDGDPRRPQRLRVGRPALAGLEDLRERDPGLVREAVILQSSWMFLNTRVPPFDRLDARRAVSLAIDRPAAVAAFGGPHAARQTCHILPPTLDGLPARLPRARPARGAPAGAALGHPRRAS